MLPLLETLLPLLKKRDAAYIVIIIVLGAMVMTSGAHIKTLDAALAARPKTDTKVEMKVKTVVHTVTVQGPERVVEKITQGEVVERVVYRDAPTTTVVDEATGTEKEYARETAPACPASLPMPWRYAGAMVDPLSTTKLVGARGGITLYNRVDLGLSWRSQPNAGALEVGVRF